MSNNSWMARQPVSVPSWRASPAPVAPPKDTRTPMVPSSAMYTMAPRTRGLPPSMFSVEIFLACRSPSQRDRLLNKGAGASLPCASRDPGPQAPRYWSVPCCFHTLRTRTSESQRRSGRSPARTEAPRHTHPRWASATLAGRCHTESKCAAPCQSPIYARGNSERVRTGWD